MTLADSVATFRDCAARARRELYMRGDRDRADKWARAAQLWLMVVHMRIVEAAADP